MAEGEKIGSGYVEIGAEIRPFEEALDALPAKAAAKLDAAMSALKARLANTRLDQKNLQADYQTGKIGTDAFNIGSGILARQEDQLLGKIKAVENAARSQAAALQQAATATRAKAAADEAAAAAAARAAAEDARHSATLRARSAAGKQAEGLDALAAMEATGQKLKKGPLGFAPAGEGRGGGDSGMMAMRMLLVGQFMDDLQYGLKSVVNNIPQLVMAFGGSAGLAGVIGIVAVAVNQLINHWDTLKGLFGDTSAQDRAMESLKGISERVQELQDKLAKGGSLTGGEVADLVTGRRRARAMEDAEAGRKAASGPGEAESRRRQDIAAAMREAGGADTLAEKAAGRMDAGQLSGFLDAAQQKRFDFVQRHLAENQTADTKRRLEGEMAGLMGTARERARESLATGEFGAAAGGDKAALARATERSPELAAAMKAQEEEAAGKEAADFDKEMDQRFKAWQAEQHKEEAEADRVFEEQRQQRVREFQEGQERMEKQAQLPKMDDEIALKEAQVAEMARKIAGGSRIAQFESGESFAKNFVGFAQRADVEKQSLDVQKAHLKVAQDTLAEAKKKRDAVYR